MGDLSIEQIKLKAFQARDLFNTYIDNLVTAGETRKASDTEIDLFNLDSFYFNKKIDNFEATKLKEKINSIDLDYLISTRAINYIQGQSKFSATRDSGDINNDETINLKDIGALNYILNFKGDPIEAIDYIFTIAGDPDKISDFYIRKWARERGMNSGTQAFDNFYNKFYNDFYKKSEPKLDISTLQQAVKLFDIGVGGENLNEIDTYMPLIKAQMSFSNIANFLLFHQDFLYLWFATLAAIVIFDP